jgi:hypothetical protein
MGIRWPDLLLSKTTKECWVIMRVIFQYPNNTTLTLEGDGYIIEQIITVLDKQVIEYYD